jgi:hypothetical protein
LHPKLLYLNLPHAEKVRIKERSELEKRLRGLGPKKAAKIGRKLTTAYDRILIGPSAEPDWVGSGAPGGLPRGDDRHVKPHWRRGHFRRIRYGEGLAESRLGWIQPILVNAGELVGGRLVGSEDEAVCGAVIRHECEAIRRVRSAAGRRPRRTGVLRADAAEF